MHSSERHTTTIRDFNFAQLSCFTTALGCVCQKTMMKSAGSKYGEEEGLDDKASNNHYH